MDDLWDESGEEFWEWIWDIFEYNRNGFLLVIAAFLMIIVYKNWKAVAHFGHSLIIIIARACTSWIADMIITLTTHATHTGISPGAYQSFEVVEFEKTQAQKRISELEKELTNALYHKETSNQIQKDLTQQLQHEQNANNRLCNQVTFLQGRLKTVEQLRRFRPGMKSRSSTNIIMIKPFDPDEYDRSRSDGPLQPTTRHPITKEIVTTAQYKQILEKLESKQTRKLKNELAQAQSEKDDLNQIIKKLQKSLEQKAQSVQEYQNTQARLEQEVQRAKEDASSEKARLTNQLKAAQEEIEEYEQTITENLENDEKELKKLKNEHSEIVGELQRQLQQAKADNVPSPIAEEPTNAATEELQEQLQAAQLELAVVREEAQAAARVTIEQLQQQLQNTESNALLAQSSVEAAARASIEQLQVQVANLSEQLRASSNAQEQVVTAAAGENQQLRAENQLLGARVAEMEAMIAHSNQELERVRGERNRVQGGLKDFQEHFEKNKSKLVECAAHLGREQQKSRELQQAFNERNALGRELEGKYREAETQLKSMRGDLRRAERLHNELIIARGEIANLKSCGTPSRLQAELRDAQMGRARAENNCAKAYKELEALRTSKVNLEIDRSSMKNQITEAKSRSFHQTQKMVELENEAKEARDANALAQTQAEDLRNDMTTKNNQLGEKEQQIKDKMDELSKQMQTLNIVQGQLVEKDRQIGIQSVDYIRKVQQLDAVKEKLTQQEVELTETKGEASRLRDYKEARILRDQAADPLAGSDKTRARKTYAEDEDEDEEEDNWQENKKAENGKGKAVNGSEKAGNGKEKADNKEEKAVDDSGAPVPATPTQLRIKRSLPVRSAKRNKVVDERKKNEED